MADITQSDFNRLIGSQVGPSLNQQLANPGMYSWDAALSGNASPIAVNGAQNQSVTNIQNALAGIQARYTRPDGSVDWQSFYPEATQFVRQNKLDPNSVAQAAQALAPQGNWDANKVQQTMAQYTPTYGLNAASNTLADTQAKVSDLFKQGVGYLQPWMQAGGQANQLQAALSGALGPEAQKQAFANYQSSPGVQFALDQGNKNITQNAAALGGLGGGNVQKALMKYGIGIAQQDYNNQFGQLGTLADRGYGASTTGAGLAANEAGLQSQLGQAGAGYQMQTGQQIGSNLANLTSALSTLQNQQGAGNADIYGNQATSIANLYQQATQGNTDAIKTLASLLQNTNMNASGQFAGQPNTPLVTSNNTQQLAQLAGGVSGLLSGIKPLAPAQSQSNLSQSPNNYISPAFTGYDQPNQSILGQV